MMESTPTIDALRAQVLQDWRALFPWRDVHREAIRAAIEPLPVELFADARAAFGLPGEVPPVVSARLYREEYIEDAPPVSPEVATDIAIGRLRRGDSEPLRKVLEGTPHDHQLLLAWYEVAAFRGRVTITPQQVRDGQLSFARFEPVPTLVAGGAPIRLVNPAALCKVLRSELDKPLGLDAHATAAITSWHALAAGVIPAELIDPTVGVLAHHGDGPISWPDGRSEVTVASASEAAEALAPAIEPLGDHARFLDHLQKGLASPSRPRRRLSHLLLRTIGSANGHYDDCMPLQPLAQAGPVSDSSF